MANLQRMDSDTSAYSFTSEQLEMGEDDELGSDIEYEVAPWDIFGVHDIDGQILAVKKGEALPQTSKYKKKHPSSDPVKFYVNKKLQVETIPYQPKINKKTVNVDIRDNSSFLSTMSSIRDEVDMNSSILSEFMPGEGGSALSQDFVVTAAPSISLDSIYCQIGEGSKQRYSGGTGGETGGGTGGTVGGTVGGTGGTSS